MGAIYKSISDKCKNITSNYPFKPLFIDKYLFIKYSVPILCATLIKKHELIPKTMQIITNTERVQELQVKFQSIQKQKKRVKNNKGHQSRK